VSFWKKEVLDQVAWRHSWLTLLNNIVVMSLIQIQQIARGLLHYAPRFNGFLPASQDAGNRIGLESVIFYQQF
jgi:hypothetical protein